MNSKLSFRWYAGIKLMMQTALAACFLLARGTAYAQASGERASSETPVSKQSTTNSESQTHVTLHVRYDYDYISPFSDGHSTEMALLPLTINGRLHGNFLLDTGTTFSSISDDTAQALGLTPKLALNNDGKPVLVDGKRASIVIVSSAKTSDGKLDFNGEFTIIPRHTLAALPEFKTVDGIIGINMLSQIGTLWDFSHHHITIFVPPTLSQEERQSLGFNQPGIPLTQATENQLFYTSVSLFNDKKEGKEQALVDTGAIYSLVSNALASQLDLRPIGVNQTTNYYGVRMVLSTVPTLFRVGDQTVLRPFIHYPRRDETWPPPLFGLDIMSRFRVLLDFQGGKMYLAPAVPLAPNITIKPASSVPNTQP